MLTPQEGSELADLDQQHSPMEVIDSSDFELKMVVFDEPAINKSRVVS